MQPHHAAGGVGAHLDQVAHLVGEPQAVAADLAAPGPLATGERRRDPALVAHLAQQHARLLPEEHPAVAAAVAHAVRGDLVDREEQVSGAVAAEPGLLGEAADEAPHGREGVEAHLVLDRGGRRVGQRVGERLGDRLEPVEERALARDAVVDHGGMRPAGRGDDVGRERVGVVRADEPERGGVGEGEVEQGLVAMALDELRGAALRMDRLADAAQGAARAGVLGHEVPPRRDDPRRVRADVGHVGEEDVVGIAAERLAQGVDLGPADDDERRIAGREAVAKERAHLGDERVEPGVQVRLVVEGSGELGVERQGHGVSRAGSLHRPRPAGPGARTFIRPRRERSTGPHGSRNA